MVDVLDRAAEEIKKSAYDECHTGQQGMTRGSKCVGLEQKRDAKLQELADAQTQKDLTDNLVGIEIAITKDKDELKDLGPKVEHTNELSEWTHFLASLHVMSAETAKTLTDFKPVTDTLAAELFGCAMTVPCILGWIWLFGLFTVHRSEAERIMVENSQAVAAELAKATAATVQQTAEAPAAPSRQAELDHSEEAVLGIEGEDLPAFAEAPQTVFEHMAAAHLKADPDKSFERKARRKKAPSKDSVRLWIKENTVPREGRFVWSTDATPDYESFCEDRNLTPVAPQTFGVVIRDEFPDIIVEKKSGRVKYHGIGLRHNLKVVSA